MLVCQCNVISDRDIRAVILDLLHEDPWEIIVPAKVYRALQQRCKCAGCVPNVIAMITEITEEYHRDLAALPTAPSGVMNRPATRRKRTGGRHERRGTGHRAA
jgi:bacterioferritin-associated ferredoxin